MRDTYSLKYRKLGTFIWSKLDRVKGDGIEERFRYFLLEDDTLIHIPIDVEIVFSSERATIITQRMSKEIGQPIQRA